MPTNRSPKTSDTVRVAIRNAINLLGKSSAEIQQSHGPENVLWKATEEAEYAAFRISIAHSLADHMVKTRLPNPTSSPGNDVDGARKLFEESLQLLDTHVTEAYERLRTGIALLRRAQSRPSEIRAGAASVHS